MALNSNKDLKLYYSIKEVSEMFDVPETTLRFWEKEFPTLVPEKSGRGIRQYSKENIELVGTIVNLVKERGMTLQGARDAIKHNMTSNVQIEVVNRLKKVRDELQILNKELNGLS